ncbi:unnamed protein product [Meganyctiphanes norvegica]|uniref:C2H2-type domain-containing protein n=1 Tax=Meganyctiphanes norvegica TaxID=48144 RepID=A0AAV2RZB9_MEGNR
MDIMVLNNKNDMVCKENNGESFIKDVSVRESIKKGTENNSALQYKVEIKEDSLQIDDEEIDFPAEIVDSEIIIHDNEDDNKRRYIHKIVCTICKKRFYRRVFLIEHMREHGCEPIPFECMKCNKMFNSAKDLLEHKKTHLEQKSFDCDKCGEIFTCTTYLTKHKFQAHREKQYSCNECDYKCSTKYKLGEHMRVRHLPKELLPHGCDICDYRTLYSKSLKEHMMRHKEIKPFICETCGFSFVTNTQLKSHFRTHTQEKIYGCNICGKKFGANSNLRVHISSHTKEKRYFCSECPYSTYARWTLNVHLKTVHSTNRPHKCMVCGNTYKTKGNLQKHQTGLRGTCRGRREEADIQQTPDMQQMPDMHKLINKEDQQMVANLNRHQMSVGEIPSINIFS